MLRQLLQAYYSGLARSAFARQVVASGLLWAKLRRLILIFLLVCGLAQSVGGGDPPTEGEEIAIEDDSAIDSDEAFPTNPKPPTEAPDPGELHGDLNFLRQFYSAPEGAQESNYFIDLWDNQNLRTLVALHGLTNNRTLFVNCHGKRTKGRRYALYPHQSLISKDAPMPYYSIGDLAGIMGPAAVSSIHNIVLSSCNAEGALDTQEIRRSFPNATNIVHSAAGELGYQSMYFQALVHHSSKVKPIYEWAERNSRGEMEYFTAPVATRNAKRFAPYIAELFTPGAVKPFAVQRAGRELLDPERFGKMASAK